MRTTGAKQYDVLGNTDLRDANLQRIEADCSKVEHVEVIYANLQDANLLGVDTSKIQSAEFATKEMVGIK